MLTGVRWGVFVALCAAFLAHAAYYHPFLSDDALISLRYAQRLCQGHGLTWTDGERVEGYTDLLWVLLNAVPTCLGANPITGARVIGTIGAALAMLIVALPRLGRPTAPSVSRLLTGAVCLASSPTVVVWAIGGLEHGFMTAPLAAGLYFALRGEGAAIPRRDAALAAACFAALALLRADGVVLFAAATLGRWAAARLRLDARTEIVWALPVVCAVAGQLAFRLVYYDEWVPNTALAKVSFNAERLRLGVSWVLLAWKPLGLLITAAVASSALSARRIPARRVVVPWAIFFGWSAYVASVGGDIFLAHRQMCPVLVPLALLIADGAERIADWPRRRRAPMIIGWLGVAAGSLALQTNDPGAQAVKRGLWEWEGLPVGRALRHAFERQRPLLAVDAAGALPFWSGLPALDMLGLNDHYLPRHPPPDFGKGPIGHELGNGEYVWSRRPDIVAFCGFRGSRRPCFRGGKEMFAMRAFRQQYQLVRVQGARGGPAGELYFRREGGPVGWRRGDDELTIPGYFFTQGAAVARPDRNRSLSTRVTRAAPGVLRGLTLPSGSWKARLASSGPELRAELRCARRGQQRDPRGDPAVIDVTAGAPIDVFVQLGRNQRGAARLHELSLVRSEGARAAARCPR